MPREPRSIARPSPTGPPPTIRTGVRISRAIGYALVSRFQSSHHCAAPSFANFGIKGTLAIYDSSAVFGFEVPTQTRGYNDRNFKSTALSERMEKKMRKGTLRAAA